MLFTSNDSPAAGTPGFDAAPSQPEVKGQIVGQLDYESRSLEFNLDLLAGGERASRHIGEACGFKQPYTGLLGSQIRLLDSQNAVIGLGSVADEAVLVQDNTAGLMDLPLACSVDFAIEAIQEPTGEIFTFDLGPYGQHSVRRSELAAPLILVIG